MKSATALSVAGASASVRAASVDGIFSTCTTSNVQAALPANGTLLGIDLLLSTVTAQPVYNASIGGGGMGGAPSTGGTTYNYCNVTVSYTHTGKGDKVVLKYALPDPDQFKSRFYVAGGGGFSLSSTATGGLPYGAASGATDAGYDAFSNSYDTAALLGNGTVNWDAANMFGYQALGEMAQVGKAIATKFYGVEKLYTYFEGCSDGGREAMSQVQRWGEEYDGVIAGAPAYHFAEQQVLHLYPGVVEQTLGYLPPPCELAAIVNATIAACDGLDGREDGVVSRTDLCQLNFDMDSVVGTPYFCSATTGGGAGMQKRQMGPGGGGTALPEQNGTVSKEAVAVAKAIYGGVKNSKGEQAYLSWQIASSLSDADTTWNNVTQKWELSISSMGGGYVAKFVELLQLDNLATLEGVTYDTLVQWMEIGMQRFYSSLETTWPDLTTFQSSGGKLLHYHGESDPSIPAASSVHYWQSVRDVMYANATQAEAQAQMEDWYQFYLVPGAGHCGTNSLQPGVFPQNNMNIMIDWVENGVKPSRLNATASSGQFAGETQMLCQFPQRPLWQGSGNATFDCVDDARSIEAWTWSFPAIKFPIF